MHRRVYFIHAWSDQLRTYEVCATSYDQAVLILGARLPALVISHTRAF